MQYRPYPVVGVISPWNFPLILSLGDAIPALMAGCAVVIKPSEFTPLSPRSSRRGSRRSAAPTCFDVVNGMGETGGPWSTRSTSSSSLAPTGPEDGHAARRRNPDAGEPRAGRQGPDDRSADCRLDAPRTTATGALANTGQICMSIERLYVEEPIYDEFVDSASPRRCASSAREMDGREHGKDVGAMTSPPQAKIVEDHVEDARQAGATVLTGGQRLEGDGDWYQPTVITGADHSMKVMT